jgi:hypothetical protein
VLMPISESARALRKSVRHRGNAGLLWHQGPCALYSEIWISTPKVIVATGNYSTELRRRDQIRSLD